MILEDKQAKKDRMFKREFLGWLFFFAGMAFLMAGIIFAFVGFLLIV